MSLGIFDSKPKVKWLRGQEADALIYLSKTRYVKLHFHPTIDAVWSADAYGLKASTAREVRFTGESGNYDRLTGAGFPLRAIMGVTHAVVEYLRKREPSMLTFSASGKRARIYEAIMRRVDVPGYRIFHAEGDKPTYDIIRMPFTPKPEHYLVPFK